VSKTFTAAFGWIGGKVRFRAMRVGRKGGWLALAGGVLVSGYLLLSIPESEIPIATAVSQPVRGEPFRWDQDEVWRTLEAEMTDSRGRGCAAVRAGIEDHFREMDRRLEDLAHRSARAEEAVFGELERLTFQTAPWIPACPDRLADFSERVTRLGMEVKRQSLHWDMGDPDVRRTLYRLLYGSRGAIEEIVLQVPPRYAPPALIPGKEEPSATPWAALLGIRIHSGDILVSRGGAATSALIARGNDFPGNFSHVALVRVDPGTHLASIVEAHIERGVAVSSLEDYVRDVKLRVLVLRLRADLAAVAADPMLPHRAAEYALGQARRSPIPYDFAMDFGDPGRWFCSEVASAAYGRYGVRLWMGLSHISSAGLRRWLAGFGVRHFATQEPSDLEYDPQLAVVAEWRDLEALRADHLDNAVTEAMLEGAESGDPLEHDAPLLPLARLVKLYSRGLNAVGRVGPIPEGMSATAALRYRWYTRRHERIKAALIEAADRFRREKGYEPPYWKLVEMARELRCTPGGAVLQQGDTPRSGENDR